MSFSNNQSYGPLSLGKWFVQSTREGGMSPSQKNLLGSRSCLVNVMKRSFTNHYIPNADGCVVYIIWKPPKQPKWNTGYFWRKELAKEEVGIYILWECCVKSFSPSGNIFPYILIFLFEMLWFIVLWKVCLLLLDMHFMDFLLDISCFWSIKGRWSFRTLVAKQSKKFKAKLL